MTTSTTIVAGILWFLALSPSPIDAQERPRCNMMAFSRPERDRHGQLIQRLKAAITQTVELPNGYGLRFNPKQFNELAEWMGLESKCCPFLTFQLELGPQPGGPLWLRLTGNAEVKEFISIEMESLLHPSATGRP